MITRILFIIGILFFGRISAQGGATLAVALTTAEEISDGIMDLYYSSLSTIESAFNIVDMSNHLYDDIISVEEMFSNDYRYTRFKNRRDRLKELEEKIVREYTALTTQECQVLGGDFFGSTQKNIANLNYYVERRAVEEIEIMKDIASYMKRMVDYGKKISNFKSNFNENINNINNERKNLVGNAINALKDMKKLSKKIALAGKTILNASEAGALTPLLVNDQGSKMANAGNSMIKMSKNIMDKAESKSSEEYNKFYKNTEIKSALNSEFFLGTSDIDRKENTDHMFRRDFLKKIEYYEERLDENERFIHSIQEENIKIRKRIINRKKWYRNQVIYNDMDYKLYSVLTEPHKGFTN